MNDKERQIWVMNDESLYNWWRGSKSSISKFVKANRLTLDEYINKILNAEPV